MAKNYSIHAVYSRSPFGHCDCLMLVNAEDFSNAKTRAMEETTILDNFDEDVIVAEDLELKTPNKKYIKIFSNDIQFKY